MYVVIVEVHVLADKIAEFLRFTRQNHEGARSEPGNRRFDVLEQKDDPTRFVLYEVYEDETAFAAISRRCTTWPGAIQSRICWRSRERARSSSAVFQRFGPD
jgi:hypothetical protein